jgi:hypothetical protein
LLPGKYNVTVDADGYLTSVATIIIPPTGQFVWNVSLGIHSHYFIFSGVIGPILMGSFRVRVNVRQDLGFLSSRPTVGYAGFGCGFRLGFGNSLF